MRVDKLSLLNFRNYSELEADLKPGKVLILGRNGQGKTNFVEAIAYFNELSSHRVSADAPLLKADEQSSVVRSRVINKQATVSLELEFKRGSAKRAQINGNGVRPRELTRYFTSVLFAPEDLLIASGEPGARRDFLYSAIVTRNPLFAAIYKDYEQIVKQRSALLKNIKLGRADINSEELDFWDQNFTNFSTRIMAERRKLIDELQPELELAYFLLVGADHAPKLALHETGSNVSRETYAANSFVTESVAFDHLGNESATALMQDFRERLQELRRAEIERGQTLIGAHRDDLKLELNALPVKGYASHGESWSIVLALKLALANLLRKDFAPEDPVLILDDVFAELDTERRKRLMNVISDYEQILVTAAVADDIPKDQLWHIYVIKKGQLIAVGSSENPTEFFQNVNSDIVE
ncbi:DNA replication/repair protein RecF [Canibacter sp. lx-72]|uniref:DNA replication/repair protein RecF n=1 Tax=Canibacter zhuwentaonis TaxID=2837491 RepID=UPI001BDC77C7|nr:DNA replication/repair protein RecF [Canibacter zhuwentaonis]